MKRITAALLALALVAGASYGCQANGANGVDSAQPGKTGKKISVVCTIFPQYDWTRQILGDKAGGVDATLLLDNKIDLHNYQPAVDDMMKISECDLFIYVGGESDWWVDAALAQAANKDMTVINLLETLGDAAKEEEIIEGMEAENVHEEGDTESSDGGESSGDGEHGNTESNAESDPDGDAGEEAEYDEHVWLSLKNARTLCGAIADALAKLDAANAAEYRSNLAAYDAKLSALDTEYRAATGAAATKTLLFGDRFPFRYMVDDYGLGYYAAFAGCSAESEASFATVIFLVEKVDELGLKTIMVTESSDQSIARTIRDNSSAKNQQILALDSMQSIGASDVADGATYLSIMQSNLDVLKDALR